MNEFLYSRNAAYETLSARRRHVIRIEIADGAQEKGRLAEILQLAAEYKIPVQRVPRSRLDKIHAGHQGVALEASCYPYAELTDIFERADRRKEALFVLLLDTLNDPQNFGALLRTAEAVGVHGVIIPLRQTVMVTPAVVNASSGACEHLLISRANLHQAIKELKDAGAWIIGMENDPQAQDPENIDLKGAMGIVVGSEGEGMRPLVCRSCDVLVKLPMMGRITSLNAAVAGSVLLYLMYMKRRDAFQHGENNTDKKGNHG